MSDNFQQRFEVFEKIGEGSFSQVLKVREKATGHMYAAKRLSKKYENFDGFQGNKEVEVLRKLGVHPNIVSLVDLYHCNTSGCLILLFELMDCSMYDYIKNRNRRLSESRVKNYMYQLVCGLHYLHRNGLFHRDIKPENILIRVNTKLRANPLKAEVVKLGDLGSTCTDRKLPHSAYIATRWYRAPECLLTSGYYGPKMDIWALGCCFYEMLTLTPLFPGDNELDQLHKIHDIVGSPSKLMLSKFKHRAIEYEFPKRNGISFHCLLPMLSSYGIDVLTRTLTYHPDPRMSVHKLIDHIYFDEFNRKNRLSASTRLKDRDCHSMKGSRTSITGVQKQTSTLSRISLDNPRQKRSSSLIIGRRNKNPLPS